MQVALVQPITLNRPDIVKHLCETHMANGLIAGSGSISPLRLARFNPQLQAIVSRAAGKAAKLSTREESRAVARGVACTGCGKTNDELQGALKHCGRCYSAYFCSKKCQKANWERHKPDCLKTREEFTVVVRPNKNPQLNAVVSFTSGKSMSQWKGEDSTPSVPAGSHFYVKVQVGESASGIMLIYNRKRDLCVHADTSNCDKKTELYHKVLSFPAFNGRKAYFKAELAAGNLVIYTGEACVKDW